MVWWKWLIYTAGGIILTVAIAFSVIAWTPAPRDVDRAALLAKANDYNVEIIRDRFGVPHIYGTTDADVSFGLGYAQAEDDWATVQDVIVLVRGEMGLQKGMEGAPTDFMVDWLSVWENVEGGYETAIPADTRAIAESYADGMNLWGAENPDEIWSGVLPVEGKDIVAGFIFRTPFFYGFQDTLARLNDGTYAREVQGVEQEVSSSGDIRVPVGSNAAAIAPQRSADGATRLLINSHQPFTGPVAWYQIHLHSDEGWNMAGGTFPGAPIVLHGHNETIGWANTVNHPDVVDLYHLTINPDDANQYLLDGEWRDFTSTTAEFRVKLWGPFSWPVSREILHAEHGTVWESEGETFAVRYAGMGEMRQLEQYYRLNRSTNFLEWARAMRMQALPSINYIYGDAEGNIAYIYNAQMPVRAEGYDWQGILPGEDSSLIWTEYQPLDNLPMVVNPASGYIINANNNPLRASDPADDAREEDFSPTYGMETRMTNRSMRLLALFGADLSITDEELLAYKFDVGYQRNSLTAQAVADAIALDVEGDPLLEQAQDILRRWNYMADLENRNAPLAMMLGVPYVAAELNQEPNPDIRELLETAAHGLQDTHGRLDPQWGEVNRLIRGDVNLPVSGAADALRAIWTMNELNEDGHLTGIAGDTLIMIAEWNTEGELRSRMVHQYGSATLDESSPHYADQAPLFAAEELYEFPMTEEAIRAQATRTYRPGIED